MKTLSMWSSTITTKRVRRGPVVYRMKQAAERHGLIQSLDARICPRLGRCVVHGQKQPGQKLHDEQRKRDTAEAVKIVEPPRHRLVHHPPVPARDSHAAVKVVEKSHV